MTALACLRITVGEDLRFADDETMATIVARIAQSHLEGVWAWPRRFGLIAPFTFLLADPRAMRLDPRELTELARSIQHTLFGEKGQGDVCLLMMEGSQTEVMRFAGAPLDQLQAIMAGIDTSAFEGRICQITPEGVVSLAPPGGPIDGELLPRKAWPKLPAQPPKLQTAWRAIYYLPKERFVGGSPLLRMHGLGDSVRRPGNIDEDLICIQAALDALEAGAKGYIFMPLDFSSIIQATARTRINAELAKLPKDQRARLAAIVLNVPREPSYSAYAHLKTLLLPHLAMVDLHISDPGFRLDLLPPGLATSITLTLDDISGENRLPAIKSFLSQQAAYRAKRVWQGVADLATRGEVDLCRREIAPFLSGPAISGLLSGPLQDLQWAPSALPYREPSPA